VSSRSAITYNNAGIVEAIKRNSGSTKFYKPNFQGIIEALEDWEGGSSGAGGGGTNVLPEGDDLPTTGNTEGDLVVIPNGNGDYFMYVFANGAWERLHITTEEVETKTPTPFALVTDDGVTVKNQKEINAYLDQRITALSEKGYDDTGIKAELAQEVTDRTEGDQALQDQIDALEAYDDTDIKADLAQEIGDREAGDQALQDQIDALEAYDDSTLSERIDDIEKDIETALGVQGQIIDRVEELPTWVSDTPPVDKNEGDLWFDSGDTAQLYVRYGGEWVVACPPVTDDDVSGAISDVEAVANEAVQKATFVQFQLDQNVEFVRWDQERQDEKIAELEGEVDDLKPSIERGEWTYNASPESGSSNNPIAGEYHAYAIISDDYCLQQLAECYAEANKGDNAQEDAAVCNRQNTECQDKIGEIDTDVPWHSVQWLVMARTDDSGRTHDFGDVVPGMYVEAINLDGSGHGLYVIQSKSVTLGRAGLEVEPVHSTGHPNGKAVIKIFKMAEAANPEDYVKKSGDEITGTLKITTAEGVNTGNALRVQAGSDLAVNQNILDVRSKSGQMFWIDSKDIGTKSNWVPTKDMHVATKKYVDEAIAAEFARVASPRPAQLAWKFDKSVTSGNDKPPDGVFRITGNYYRFSFKTANGVDLGKSLGSQINRDLTNGPCGSVWYQTDGGWKYKHEFRIKTFNWNFHDHFEMKWSSWQGQYLSDGFIYYVTVGGFF